MTKLLKNKKGFGIVEILVAAAVLGFMYMAVLNLQGGNHDALLRIRGRDGAIEVVFPIRLLKFPISTANGPVALAILQR